MSAMQDTLIHLVVSAQLDTTHLLFLLLPAAHAQMPIHYALNALMPPTVHFAILDILEISVSYALLGIKILTVEFAKLDISCKILSASLVLVMFIFAVSSAKLDLLAMFAQLDIPKEPVLPVIQDIMNQLTLHLLALFVPPM